jgi:hypothetical protein
MNADRVVVKFHDLAGDEWCDVQCEIFTSTKQIDDLASQTSVDTVDTVVDAILVDTGTDIPASITALNNLSQADIRSAVGLASANLDAQLSTIDGVADDIKAQTDQLTFTDGAVDGNVTHVNDIAVDGSGTEGDPWGPV